MTENDCLHFITIVEAVFRKAIILFKVLTFGEGLQPYRLRTKTQGPTRAKTVDFFILEHIDDCSSRGLASAFWT